MPVVMGSQQIANFVQTSLPLAGTICMAAFLVLLLAALVVLGPRGAAGGRHDAGTHASSFAWLGTAPALAGVGRPACGARRIARRPSPATAPGPSDSDPRRLYRTAPGPDRTDWLLTELARAPDGATIEVPAGIYRGPFIIDRAVRLHGDRAPTSSATAARTPWRFAPPTSRSTASRSAAPASTSGTTTPPSTSPAPAP